MNNVKEQLKDIKDAGLHREFQTIQSPQGRIITIEGSDFLNFSSNDYLGLANHPDIKQAMCSALEHYGVGSGASRYMTGNYDLYNQVENQLSAFMKAESCLLFNTGYMANLGGITSLVGDQDTVIIDRLCHASIIDGCRLSGAKIVVYKHGDVTDLKKQLIRYGGQGQTLVITESLFSMDGDCAPLKEICSLADQYEAMLMVDEAHAFGVRGSQGRGVLEQLDLQGRATLVVGTLGKAAGVSGGFVCGQKEVIDLIRNKARSSIYTTAMPPVLLAAIKASLTLIQKGKTLRESLQDHVSFLKTNLTSIAPNIQSQIIPLMIGGNEKTKNIADKLKEKGIFVPAMRYPTVKKGTERLRLSVAASHTRDDLSLLIDLLKEFL